MCQPIVCTPNQIFTKLMNQNIYQNQGSIVFNFMNVTAQINEKSAIGDLFQEWLANWFKAHQIYYRTNLNSQIPPDFYLDPNSDKVNLLEVKTFDYQASPNFDVANFQAYCDSIKDNAYRLDADYIIFAYELVNYVFQIKQIWLKKIWEITCPMENLPVRCQVKRKEIVNIRPANWYSRRAKYKPFSSRRDFVQALHTTLLQYNNTKNTSTNWFIEVQNNYYNHTSQAL